MKEEHGSLSPVTEFLSQNDSSPKSQTSSAKASPYLWVQLLDNYSTEVLFINYKLPDWFIFLPELVAQVLHTLRHPAKTTNLLS
jgi:hypothetical protein